MFGIEWLYRGSVIARETSMTERLAVAVASARRRAKETHMRLGGPKPDAFVIRDASGENVLGIYHLAEVA